MMQNDWSSFMIRIDIKAPPKKLYEAWATRHGLEHWFLRSSEFKTKQGKNVGSKELVEKGITYHWLWHGYPDDSFEEGEILEANGMDQLVFSFGKAGICTVRIYKEKGETIVEIKQEKIPVDEKSQFNFHVGCKTGWTFYLANLKSLYEGGIDLRNKNEQLQNVLNA